MLLVNTDFITGKELQTLGLVWASFGAAESFGGGIGRVNEELEKKANRLGADAIINIRYSGDNHKIHASGTAVKFV